MTTESKGRDLFIVDNSVSGWTGLRYLEEWSGIAKAFDIATGCFEIGSLLAHAQEALKNSDFDKVLRMLKAALNVDPTNAKAASALKGATNVIMNALEAEGIVAKKVPKLVKTFDEISQMNFTPNEGFMISRINGVWDLGSIVKISPLREIDSLLIFRKLQRDGIVTLT